MKFTCEDELGGELVVTLTNQQAEALIAAASASVLQLEQNPLAGQARNVLVEARNALAAARYPEEGPS